ncbi:MAG: SRPBCC domain-containing protein [Nocardioides sp.]
MGLIDVDPVPGGHWRLTMVANDDHERRSPLNTTLVEVVENQLLVGHEVVSGFPGLPDGSTVTLSVELHPEGDGTRLELRQGPFSEGMTGPATAGWGQSFHKLDGLLASPPQFRPGGRG